MLLGRTLERARLDSLLGRARAGTSDSLLVRGSPGVGKSALLQYAASQAGDLAVLQASGVQAEADLPFAALHQLLRPIFGRLESLPPPQQQALKGALALGPGLGDDRFVVAAAVLTLIAHRSGDGGLLCILDDAHWIDRPSLDALLFCGRRLDAEGVALIFAERVGEERHLRDSGLAVMDVGGLDLETASALVAECAGVPVSDVAMEQLVRLTDGNALALAELATLLDHEQLLGREPLPDPLPVGAGMEQAFLARARTLPPETQLLLLVAAAEGAGDLRTVLGGAGRLGLADGALDVAEAAGLLTVSGASLQFRHPLVRSAVYGGASSSQRRSVHLALSEVLLGDETLERRAWHAAAAALGPDETVAADLAASADRARRRSAHAAAAASMRRSAELTTDPELRAHRLVEAARDAWIAGQPDQAYTCLDQAERSTSDSSPGDDITHLRARFELRCGVATEAFRMFLDGAAAMAPRAPGRALEMLAEAAEAAEYVGDTAGVIAAGRRAEEIPTGGHPDLQFWQDVAVGIADALEGRLDAAEPRLRRVLSESEEATPARLVYAAAAAVHLGDVAAAASLFERAARTARVSDMTGNLPYILEFLVVLERLRGRYTTSQALAEEGLALARETRQVNCESHHLANLAHLAAIRGDNPACRSYADQALALALPRRLGLSAAFAFWALAVLDLGAGRHADALARLKQVGAAGPGSGHPTVVLYSLPDRVEAGVRCGDVVDACHAQDRLEEWTAHSGTLSMRAVVTRCRALLATGDQTGSLFAKALELHEQGGGPASEMARTQLLYGEWLRRTRRSVESREHLRAAAETFTRLGAAPLAARATAELRAAGETSRRRDVDDLARLTPRELRIAQAVVEGNTTKDIAAMLFLSPRTVEYHLYKIYPKLGISSRADLVRLVAQNPELMHL